MGKVADSRPKRSRGPHTRNPILYVLARPEAKATLYRLEADREAKGYEELRLALGVVPETFHRVTRRLSQFDLVRIRASRGAEFEDRRIRVVVELSPKGRRLLPLLHKLDQTVREHEAEVGRDIVATFFEAAA